MDDRGDALKMFVFREVEIFKMDFPLNDLIESIESTNTEKLNAIILLSWTFNGRSILSTSAKKKSRFANLEENSEKV